ncbi:MAG: hypothetical protein PHW46_03100, partial [Candidatus Omnitrophica bacterium]|nr:hypothetical protein [Candidatus Omnitrophota bacterium]
MPKVVDAKEKTIFHPANMQFFFREMELIPGTNVSYLRCRIKDPKENARDYFVVLSHAPDGNRDFSVVGVYTEKEFEHFTKLGEFSPQRSDKDEKAIARYLEHERAIDEFIRKKMLAQDFAEIEGRAKELGWDEKFPERIKPKDGTRYWSKEIFNSNLLNDYSAGTAMGEFLGTLGTSFDKALGDKNIVFVRTKSNEFPEVEVNGEKVKVYSHASQNAVYVFIEERVFDKLTNVINKKTDKINDVFARVAVLDIADRLIHEIGVTYDLFYKLTNDDDKGMITQNALDVLWDEFKDKIFADKPTAKKRPAGDSVPPLDRFSELKKLKGPQVDLRRNLPTRDYAMGKKNGKKKNSGVVNAPESEMRRAISKAWGTLPEGQDNFSARAQEVFGKILDIYLQYQQPVVKDALTYRKIVRAVLYRADSPDWVCRVVENNAAMVSESVKEDIREKLLAKGSIQVSAEKPEAVLFDDKILAYYFIAKAIQQNSYDDVMRLYDNSVNTPMPEHFCEYYASKLFGAGKGNDYLYALWHYKREECISFLNGVIYASFDGFYEKYVDAKDYDTAQYILGAWKKYLECLQMWGRRNGLGIDSMTIIACHLRNTLPEKQRELDMRRRQREQGSDVSENGLKGPDIQYTADDVTNIPSKNGGIGVLRTALPEEKKPEGMLLEEDENPAAVVTFEGEEPEDVVLTQGVPPEQSGSGSGVAGANDENGGEPSAGGAPESMGASTLNESAGTTAGSGVGKDAPDKEAEAPRDQNVPNPPIEPLTAGSLDKKIFNLANSQPKGTKPLDPASQGRGKQALELWDRAQEQGITGIDAQTWALVMSAVLYTERDFKRVIRFFQDAIDKNGSAQCVSNPEFLLTTPKWVADYFFARALDTESRNDLCSQGNKTFLEYWGDKLYGEGMGKKRLEKIFKNYNKIDWLDANIPKTLENFCAFYRQNNELMKAVEVIDNHIAYCAHEKKLTQKTKLQNKFQEKIEQLLRQRREIQEQAEASIPELNLPVLEEEKPSDRPLPKVPEKEMNVAQAIEIMMKTPLPETIVPVSKVEEAWGVLKGVEKSILKALLTGKYSKELKSDTYCNFVDNVWHVFEAGKKVEFDPFSKKTQEKIRVLNILDEVHREVNRGRKPDQSIDTNMYHLTVLMQARFFGKRDFEGVINFFQEKAGEYNNHLKKLSSDIMLVLRILQTPRTGGLEKYQSEILKIAKDAQNTKEMYSFVASEILLGDQRRLEMYVASRIMHQPSVAEYKKVAADPASSVPFLEHYMDKLFGKGKGVNNLKRWVENGDIAAFEDQVMYLLRCFVFNHNSRGETQKAKEIAENCLIYIENKKVLSGEDKKAIEEFNQIIGSSKGNEPGSAVNAQGKTPAVSAKEISEAIGVVCGDNPDRDELNKAINALTFGDNHKEAAKCLGWANFKDRLTQKKYDAFIENLWNAIPRDSDNAIYPFEEKTQKILSLIVAMEQVRGEKTGEIQKRTIGKGAKDSKIQMSKGVFWFNRESMYRTFYAILYTGGNSVVIKEVKAQITALDDQTRECSKKDLRHYQALVAIYLKYGMTSTDPAFEKAVDDFKKRRKIEDFGTLSNFCRIYMALHDKRILDLYFCAKILDKQSMEGVKKIRQKIMPQQKTFAEVNADDLFGQSKGKQALDMVYKTQQNIDYVRTHAEDV